MLLSEARPRPYRQPESERKFNQKEIDDKYFDELKDHAIWNKHHGKNFINAHCTDFKDSDAVARNPRSTIRAYCKNVIRDMFIPYYKQHVYELIQDHDISVQPYETYHDSVNVGVVVNTQVDIHRPLEQQVFQIVGEFVVSGNEGSSIVSIEKDAVSGRDVSDALFNIIMCTDVGQQYEKILNRLEFFAYDGGKEGKDGFEYEKDYLVEDPEVRKLLELISVEIDKKIMPIIADVSKKLMSLKVQVSKHISEFYKY